MKRIVIIILFMLGNLFAQDIETLTKKVNTVIPGQSRFLLRGYAHSGLELIEGKTSFVGGSFNPIFLWQQSTKLLFEAELELELEDAKTYLALEYANMSYFLSKYLSLRLGYFLLPFGTFGERLHPRWINRMPSTPLGFGHDPVGPIRDMGVEIRGGHNLRTGKINYALYITNGPRLNDGSDPELETEEAGMLIYKNYSDNNTNKAVGGRIGLLPFSNSSLEIGISGQYAKVGDTGTRYKNTAALLSAVDVSYVRNILFFKGVLDIKGQFNRVTVDNADYYSNKDSAYYSFKNISGSYYMQASFRPAYVYNAFFKNIEFVGRYSSLSFPGNALWNSEQTQWAAGINYWLDWRTVLKIAYQVTERKNNTDKTASENNAVFIHWAFGF